MRSIIRLLSQSLNCRSGGTAFSTSATTNPTLDRDYWALPKSKVKLLVGRCKEPGGNPSV